MKNINFPLMISIVTVIMGLAAWIPNFFFYNPENPNMFIFLTPIIGIVGIIFSLRILNPALKKIMIILNVLVTISFALVMLLGVLLFGP